MVNYFLLALHIFQVRVINPCLNEKKVNGNYKSESSSNFAPYSYQKALYEYNNKKRYVCIIKKYNKNSCLSL